MVLRVDFHNPETDPSVIPYTIDDLVSDIKPGFAFARYGDGEWKLVLDSPWHPSNDENFTPDLCEAMRGTLLNHNGVKLGMQSVEYLQKRELFEPAQKWMQKHNLEFDWYEGDVFHKASVKGKLQKFADAVRGAVVVGPDYLTKLPFVEKVIPVPRAAAWSHKENVFKEASKLKDCIVLVSAGPLAKVLVHHLHGLGNNLAVIDTGAVFDVYCGRKSRGYMRDKRNKFLPLKG